MLHRVTFKIKVLVGIKCVFDKAYYYLRSSNIVFYQDLLTLQLLSIHYVGLTTYKNLKALSNILYNYTLAVQFPLCWIWILDNESVFWVIRICGMVSAYFLWCRYYIISGINSSVSGCWPLRSQRYYIVFSALIFYY